MNQGSKDKKALGLRWAAGAAASLIVALTAMGMWGLSEYWPRRMLLLPMFGAMDDCLLAESSAASERACGGVVDSAHKLINDSLEVLGPRQSPDGRYRSGYALNVPLLRMFKKQADGSWVVNRDIAKRVANTIRELDRPVLLYLFSTHFQVGGELENQLAADPENLAYTQNGPMPRDKYHQYYNLDIMPWSVARTDNPISMRRKQAMDAVLDEFCELPFWARHRLVGVTVLGEVHHLFPDFEAGMGYSKPYKITDYSPPSKQGFRDFLSRRFGSVEALNEEIGADYGSFTDVVPPGLDIRKDRLSRFHDHIDAYASGTLPVSGWVHVNDGHPTRMSWVRIYLNGKQVGRVPVDMGRQDVLAANPALGTADVGWRFDVNHASLPPGLHRLEVVLERESHPDQFMGSRTVGVIDRLQQAPKPVPQQAHPDWEGVGVATSAWIDSPTDHLSVYFNPLANLWHQFRAEQVTAYLKHMADHVKRSCVPRDKVYTHQIIPFTNPGWDATRFAIDDSLSWRTGMNLGVSLYGEPTYGMSFRNWMQRQNADRRRLSEYQNQVLRPYGITEFHPLKAMGPEELDRALWAHRQTGANFVSFFAELRHQGGRFVQGEHTFGLDPDNAKFGSDQLYQSFATLLRQPKR